MHILQPCQDGWLSLLEQKRKISPGRCRSATPPFLIVMSHGGGAGHFRGPTRPVSSDITSNAISSFTYLFIYFLFCSHYPLLAWLYLCVRVHARKHTCLIMSLLSHHCLMGFNSWCLEQMRAPVRASWCAWGHKDSASSIRKAFVLFLFA